MNDRERVIAVLEKQRTTERVPCGFWFHFLDEPEKADYLEDRAVLDELVEGHRRYFAAFKPELVKIMTDGFFNYPVDGGPLETAADLARVRPIDRSHPWIEGQVELARRIADLAPDVCRFFNVFSPATSMRFLIGRDLMARIALDAPDALSSVLEVMSRGLSVLAKAVIAEGRADGLYLSVQNPDSSRFSDELLDRLVKPSELAVLEAARSVGGRDVLHVCGYEGARNNLSFYADYPAQAFSWAVNVEGVSLAEGRRLFGDKAVIGGFPNGPGTILHSGTREEIAAFVERLAAETGRAGLIVGADCTLQPDVDVRRLLWVREALND
jgi:uroporphyrinogen decarboxylase